ncbi:hypothetical protein VYU27_010692, partial [Nannochloropsis oceanica]
TRDNALGFDVEGSAILVVENPDDPPQSWRYTQRRLPGSHKGLTWSAALFNDEEGGYLYLVGVAGTGMEAKQVLARLPLSSLSSSPPSSPPSFPSSSMEVWAQASPPSSPPSWLPLSTHLAAGSASTLVPLFPPGTLGVSECSVYYHPHLKSYLMVTLPAFANELLLWRSPSMTGPWAKTHLVNVEEMEKEFQKME